MLACLLACAPIFDACADVSWFAVDDVPQIEELTPMVADITAEAVHRFQEVIMYAPDKN